MREGRPGILFIAFHQTLGRNSMHRILQAADDEAEFVKEL